MALWQKTVAPFSEHKGGVGPFLKIPRSNSGAVGLKPLKGDDKVYVSKIAKKKCFIQAILNWELKE